VSGAGTTALRCRSARTSPSKGAAAISETFDLAAFAFLLDVDGTLIDIAPTPQSVHVPEQLRRDLRQLGTLTDGATALVSGRPLRDLDRLFGPLGIALVGGHGAERRIWREGVAHEDRAPPLTDSVRQRCIEIASASDKILIEDKGYSIAIHYRLAPDFEQAVRDAAAAIVADAGNGKLTVMHGKAVVEIKHAGLSKGSGIRALMTQAPFAGRRPVFVGDDITDEDAFAAMPDFGGIAFSVGRTVEGAIRRFETPADVRQWIAQICRTKGQPD